MDYARIQAGVVVDVKTGRADTPADFDPANVAEYVECPPDVRVGLIYEAGSNTYREPDAHAGQRVITPLQFLNRIPIEVRLMIRGAARGTDATALAMEDFLDQLRLAQEVDLDSPVTIGALDAMVAGGILTAEQKAAILS